MSIPPINGLCPTVFTVQGEQSFPIFPVLKWYGEVLVTQDTVWGWWQLVAKRKRWFSQMSLSAIFVSLYRTITNFTKTWFKYYREGSTELLDVFKYKILIIRNNIRLCNIKGVTTDKFNTSIISALMHSIILLELVNILIIDVIWTNDVWPVRILARNNFKQVMRISSRHGLSKKRQLWCD